MGRVLVLEADVLSTKASDPAGRSQTRLRHCESQNAMFKLRWMAILPHGT